MKRLYVLATALLMALTLAACSGGAAQPGTSAAGTQQAGQPSAAGEVSKAPASEAPESADIIEPEQLISKEEAASIAGGVNDGEKSEQPAVGQKICVYDTTDGSGFLQISLTQLSFMNNDANSPESLYKALKDAVADKDQQTVDGVGDEYFFGTPGLHILYKGYYINIAAGNSDSAKVQDVLKQAGALAVKNLDALLAK